MQGVGKSSAASSGSSPSARQPSPTPSPLGLQSEHGRNIVERKLQELSTSTSPPASSTSSPLGLQSQQSQNILKRKLRGPSAATSPPVSEVRVSSIPSVEATPITDDTILVPLPEPLPWWKKQQKYILIGMGVIIIALAVAIGVRERNMRKKDIDEFEMSTSSPQTSSPVEDPSQSPVVISTVIPSRKPIAESKPGSETPSMKPTAQPTTSPENQPTHKPSPPPSVHPSMSPTQESSTSPSQQPTPLLWKQVGDVLTSDLVDADSGVTLDLSQDGSTVAVGIWGGDNDRNDPGRVTIYREDEGVWIRRGLTLIGEAGGHMFGFALSLSYNGRRVAIGAYGKDQDSGEVKVFGWDDFLRNYQQLTAIDSATTEAAFGRSVDLSPDGQVLAIGAPRDGRNGNNAGLVSVHSDESSWGQLDAINGNASGERVGISVALSSDGNILVVGSPYIENKTGRVEIYMWDEIASKFEQIGSNLAGLQAGDFFGSSVDLSSDGKKLVIGATQKDVGGEGYVQAFAWDPSSLNFKEQGQAITGISAGEEFGSSISLSDDGTTLAVGAWGLDPLGYVNVYEWNELRWKKFGQTLRSNTETGSFSGDSLALSGNGKKLALGGTSIINKDIISTHVRVLTIDGW